MTVQDMMDDLIRERCPCMRQVLARRLGERWAKNALRQMRRAIRKGKRSGAVAGDRPCPEGFKP